MSLVLPSAPLATDRIRKKIMKENISTRKIRPPAQSLSNLIPAKMAERSESLNQQVQTILRTKMNTRKLASNVKNICARRRETWKKSYKSFSKSTHSQDPESVYAGPKERDEACQWIHHQALSLQVAPDTMATAYSLFDRALFSMKVKRSHVGVLAAACLSLSVKLLEDEICKSLGKYLIKKANLTFSMRDLIRMEMMLLQKFDWKIDEVTSIDFLFAIFEMASIGGAQFQMAKRTKNIFAHFLAAELVNFELARINSLDIALGALMTVNAKGTFKVKAQLKMNGISFDLKMANEAATFLRPKFKKLRIPRDFFSGEEDHEILPAISKLFSHGCLEPTPFGRHSFADIAAAAI